MDNVSALVSLKYVVMQVFDDLETYSLRQIKHYMNIAKRGLLELNINVIKDISTVELEVDYRTGVADLPDDYMTYHKIAVIRNGELYPLSRNDNIPMILNQRCGDEDNKYHFPDITNLQTSKWSTRYSMTGGRYAIEYRIDHLNRKLLIKGGSPGDAILLEYISTGLAIEENEVMVPRYAVDAIREYVHWQRVEYNPTVHHQEKERRQKAYYMEARKAAKIRRPFNVQEIMDAINSQAKSTPKR